MTLIRTDKQQSEIIYLPAPVCDCCVLIAARNILEAVNVSQNIAATNINHFDFYSLPVPPLCYYKHYSFEIPTFSCVLVFHVLY